MRSNGPRTDLGLFEESMEDWSGTGLSTAGREANWKKTDSENTYPMVAAVMVGLVVENQQVFFSVSVCLQHPSSLQLTSPYQGRAMCYPNKADQ